MTDDDEEELLLPPTGSGSGSGSGSRVRGHPGGKPWGHQGPNFTETVNAETSPDSLAEVKYEGFSEFQNSNSTLNHVQQS